MKRFCFYLWLCAAAFAGSARAQEALDGAVWGALAVRADGDTLLDVRSGNLMVPASNVKIITAGTALETLGRTFRWDTNLAYSGTIEDGVLKGDIYIIGGGDPTIAAGGDADAVFAQWREMMLAKGITAVDGNIIGDPRYYDGLPEATSWQYEDIGFYYGKGPEALNWYKNSQDLKVEAGKEVGDPVKISVTGPQLPWMRFSHNSVTAATGTGDKLYYYNSDLAPVGSMRGTLGIDIKSKNEQTSNRFPAYTCAYFFHKYLQQNQVTITGCYADISPDGLIRTDLDTPGTTKAAEWIEMKNIGSSYSIPLSQVIIEMLHTSDNFYAEATLQATALAVRGHTDFASGTGAIEEFVENLGIDTGGMRLKDGSGLSRANYVSPAFFVSFLGKMMETPSYDVLLEALPQPGYGTLASYMSGAPQSVKARVRMKTGSMDGVRCLSGYILPADGKKENTIIFSIMVNNSTAASRSIIAELDRIILNLAR
ncbi:MAG: D-alanyl-D-alanine carboxypeptidase/D-alanyl-D-alanine-endopeptidase [Bacteroidales bacterium]|nr:D-alanyl-D-alanine carboxypeptidase/D-alanyl-D-alanine-endopeptidase [Bacteroidales bacterium]